MFTPPSIRATPKGLTPAYWVNCWHWSAKCFATDSTPTSSSYMRRLLCEKNRALSTWLRASGMYPAAATPMWSSILNIFWAASVICSFRDRSSTAMTTPLSGLDAHGHGATAHRLDGILDLVEAPIRGKHRDCPIVALLCWKHLRSCVPKINLSHANLPLR